MAKILLSDTEIIELTGESFWLAAGKRVAKAQAERIIEWLDENGARFMTEVEGHKGFYELDWEKLEALKREVKDERKGIS